MFSKSKINDPGPRIDAGETPKPATETVTVPERRTDPVPVPDPAPKPPASVLGSDLTVKGNLETTGDLQIEGTVEGDIRGHLLTVGEPATVKGEVVADEVVVNGRVVGRVRGLKVRLSSTARVEGDIIHKTIAIESGAHFGGSVSRRDDPLNGSASGTRSETGSHATEAPASVKNTPPSGPSTPNA